MEDCIVCNSNKKIFDGYSTKYLGLPAGILVVECGNCTLRRLSPNYSVEQYRKMYEEQYFEDIPEDYEELAARRLPRFEKRIKKIIKLIGSSNITMLDIGAATGEFVHVAHKAGINAVGIELSRYACDKAKEKYAIELIHGDASTLTLCEEAYDVVHMNHVLEHIVDPHEILKKIRLSLKKGGYLVLEIPYQFGSVWERCCETFGLTRPVRFSIYSIHHPYFYTPKALKHLLLINGYSINSISAWREYFLEKKIEAMNHCKFASFFFPEVWLRTMDVIFREKGKFNIIVAYARK
jgi:ubiquinone/menaquinone biosynthesis C-methylase UbiE